MKTPRGDELAAYQFGDWLVHPGRNCLVQPENEQHLAPKSMDLLVCLLEQPHQVVPTDALLDRVWAGRCVESSIVHRKINQLRQALGDDPKQPRYIETITKRGYQAIAAVTRTTSCWDFDLPIRRRRGLRIHVPPFDIVDRTAETVAFADELYDDLTACLSHVLPGSLLANHDAFRREGPLSNDTTTAAHEGSLALNARLRSRGHRVRVWLSVVDLRTRSLLRADSFDSALDGSDHFSLPQTLAREMSNKVLRAIEEADCEGGAR